MVPISVFNLLQMINRHISGLSIVEKEGERKDTCVFPGGLWAGGFPSAAQARNEKINGYQLVRRCGKS